MFNNTPEFEQDVASPTVSHNCYGNPKLLVATPGTLETEYLQIHLTYYYNIYLNVRGSHVLNNSA